jgi:hypothetical protein
MNTYNAKRYRNNYNTFVYSEMLDYGFDNDKSKFIEEDEVIKMIDDFETKIKEIESLLDPIEGLSEIEDIKIKVKELVDLVY